MTDELVSDPLAGLTCNVCGTNDAAGVCSMPGVPTSFAYCHECLQANAHPYDIVVANTASCGGLRQTADWWQELVQDTLRHLGISHVKFMDDVEVTQAEYRKIFEAVEGE